MIEEQNQDTKPGAISIPELSLVVLIGVSGSGKSTFARRNFRATEILSSDFCRGIVSDDENDQAASADAFEVLRFIAEKRLSAGRLTVIDATNVSPEARQPLVALARRQHVLPVAIVLNLPESICQARNRERADRELGQEVVPRQLGQLRRSVGRLAKEGFRRVIELRTPEEVEAATVERQKLWNDKRGEHGPFDIVGDVHGCRAELEELVLKLGYDLASGTHPAGRKLVFLGDLVDRGPDVPGVLRLVMGWVARGTALCIPGNHEVKLLKKLNGGQVKVTHGLAESLRQLEGESPAFLDEVRTFLDGLVSHYVLDEGKLVVAHAGLEASLQGRASAKVRSFALYGDTTGETDEFGLPVRQNWALEYRGRAMVVFGHTPVPRAEWLNNTICVDTGCVYGGELTALRYPERELVSVKAHAVWCEPVKPLGLSRDGPSAQQAHDELLDAEDVLAKRVVTTRWLGPVTIREEQAKAALEAMSRFAVDPRWLIYLPPTMSPCATAASGPLEHPREALGYFKREGVPQVICQEKHMGSRIVLVVAKDEKVALRRFGTATPKLGISYTRTGRRFFDDEELEQSVLARAREAVEAAGLWESLGTDWLCLDAELMPWSVKARELLRSHYAPVGTASTNALAVAVNELRKANEAGAEVAELLSATTERLELARRYVDAYRSYAAKASSLEDLRIAPFQILASEGRTYFHRSHLWHLETIDGLSRVDPMFVSTRRELADPADPSAEGSVAKLWEELTEQGGEGIVVKPVEQLRKGSKGLVQPALKCRGPEYLRIIYGPEYSRVENLERLRSRALGLKRSLALRELVLGVEALERFVAKEPLRRVHECVFGVLALESEPVDTRL
ncbi:MAG: polynucleotide kinase-phosphatase [Deltaproteobacteria bacterium]|nr:polynucleotide kinase-phosphatase [Deltaproteobacteria bacterium]